MRRMYAMATERKGLSSTMKQTLKVLNLYAGIGGNRELWKDVEVVAVENNEKRALMYQERFPYDTVIVADAHSYLLNHFADFDFIWSSPPCQTHSRINHSMKGRGIFRYPDMRLYAEILFLQKYYDGKWCVENVIPFYEPLIKPQIVGRHCLWANFRIPHIKGAEKDVGGMNGPWQRAKKFTQEERNAVDPRLGAHVLECAFKVKQATLGGCLYT